MTWQQFCEHHQVTAQEREALFWHLLALRIREMFKRML